MTLNINRILVISFVGMLDHIMVETGGAKISLNRVAVVSVIDPQTLSVTPYDPNVSTLVKLDMCY